MSGIHLLMPTSSYSLWVEAFVLVSRSTNSLVSLTLSHTSRLLAARCWLWLSPLAEAARGLGRSVELWSTTCKAGTFCRGWPVDAGLAGSYVTKCSPFCF